MMMMRGMADKEGKAAYTAVPMYGGEDEVAPDAAEDAEAAERRRRQLEANQKDLFNPMRLLNGFKSIRFAACPSPPALGNGVSRGWRRKTTETPWERVDHHCRRLFPAVFLLFNALYWFPKGLPPNNSQLRLGLLRSRMWISYFQLAESVLTADF